MTSIKLTKEQRYKLREMCKELFPEYTFDFTWLNQNQGECPELKFWNGDMKDSKFIHWFEFYINYLLPKFNFEPNLLLNSGLKNNHLVDYLYNEFKINKNDRK